MSLEGLPSRLLFRIRNQYALSIRPDALKKGRFIRNESERVMKRLSRSFGA
jgi:hypothetical protein